MKDKDKFTQLHRHKASANRNDKGASLVASSAHGVSGGFPSNGTNDTVTIDKFAFTDEDESLEDKKLSMHRSTERKRRGKISRGIHQLWDLLPAESKGSSSKETLVGMLDKVAAYIEETQEKLRACLMGQGDQVQMAHVETLEQRVQELTDQNQKYQEALKQREPTEFVTSPQDAISQWKGKGTGSVTATAACSVASPQDDQLATEAAANMKESPSKETKKRCRGNTVGEHLQRVENARSEKEAEGVSSCTLGSGVTPQSPFLQGVPALQGFPGNANGPLVYSGGSVFPGGGLMTLRPPGVGGVMNLNRGQGMMMMSPNMTSVVPMANPVSAQNSHNGAMTVASSLGQPSAGAAVTDMAGNEVGKTASLSAVDTGSVPPSYNMCVTGSAAGPVDVQNSDANTTMVTQSINMSVPLMSATQSGVNPLLQGPSQTPLVNMSMMSANQAAGMPSLQVPGMAPLPGNLVFQNGQLVLVNNDLTSAAMAAAGIPQGMLGTPTGTDGGDAAQKLSENDRTANGALPSASGSSTPIPCHTPVGTPVSENPPITPAVSTWMPNVAVNASMAPTGTSNLLPPQFSVANMNMPQTITTTVAQMMQQQGMVNSLNLAPGVGGNLTMPQGGTAGMPSVFLPPGGGAGMGVMNQQQVNVSHPGGPGMQGGAPIMVNAAGQPIQMFPNQGMPPMTFMTPQGQLMTLPQGSAAAQSQGGLVTLNTTPSTPNQFPSALILPNGQIVPVVTQPSLLFPQQGATPTSQVVMASTASGLTVGTKPAQTLTGRTQALPQSVTTQGQATMSSGLLMTTTTVTIPTAATTAGMVKSVSAIPGSAMLPHQQGTVTQSTITNPHHDQAPQANTMVQSGICSTSTSRVPTDTSVTSVTYSSASNPRLPTPGLNQPSLVQAGFPQLGVRPATGSRPVMTATAPVPIVRAPVTAAATVPQPNAGITKAGHMVLQKGQSSPANSSTKSSQSSGSVGSSSTAATTVSNPSSSTTGSTPATSTSGLPSMPLTAVLSADGSIVLSLPPGATPGSFMLDPNTFPSLIAGLPAGGSTAGMLPPGVKKGNKKAGQRVLMPKPPTGSGTGLVSNMSPVAGLSNQGSLWGSTLVSTPTTTSSGEKVTNSTVTVTSASDQVSTTTPLTINTSDSNTPSKSASLSSNANASAPDILARAAESIFCTSVSDISPPISSFYNTANEDNALQIDTSAGETPTDKTENSTLSVPSFKAATIKPKSKRSGSSSSSKKSKKKKTQLPKLTAVADGQQGSDTAPGAPLQTAAISVKSPLDSITSPKPCQSPHAVVAPSPVIPSPMQSPQQQQNPLGPSPMHSAFGDDNDGMVIDLQTDLQTEPLHQSPDHNESEEGTDPPNSTSNKFTSRIANLSMPANFDSTSPLADKNVGENNASIEPSPNIEFADVVESSLVASGIKIETPKSLRHAHSPAALLSPKSKHKSEAKAKPTKDSASEPSSSGKVKSKSRHKKSKSSKNVSTSSVKMDMPQDFLVDTSLNVTPVVGSEPTVLPVTSSPSLCLSSPTLSLSSPTLSLSSPSQSLSSPKSKKKSSSKKSGRIQLEVLLPDTINFTESELSEVLDQVESLGQKFEPQTKSSAEKKQRSHQAEGEPPSKKKKCVMVGTEIAEETENSDSMPADLLERAMKDIGPLDMDLSEPESLSEAPVFGRLLSTENKTKSQGSLNVNATEEDGERLSAEDQDETEVIEDVTNIKTEDEVCPGSLKVSVSSAQHTNLPSLISQPQSQSSPAKSIFDSVSSMVATSSATTTQPTSMPMSTVASSTSSTMDTFSHPIFSMPSLTSSQPTTPLTTPLELSPTMPSNPSCSASAPSPPAISSSPTRSDFDAKPIARHTNLLSLAQTVAPATPKHPGSVFIAQKHMGSMSSNVTPTSRTGSQSINSVNTSSATPSSTANQSTLNRGSQMITSHVASSASVPTSNTASLAGTVNSMSSVGSDSEMDTTSVAKNNTPRVKSESVNLMGTSNQGKNSSVGGRSSIKSMSNCHSSTDNNSGIPAALNAPMTTGGSTVPLTHLSKPLSLSQANLQQQQQQPPCQDGMSHKPHASSPGGRLDQHTSYSSQSSHKGSHSQSASPASSFTSPPHTNYSAELLFSPSASSTASKSPGDHSHQTQAQNLSQVHIQSQPTKAPAGMSEQNQRRQDSNTLQHQMQQTNFYSAESMVSKSSPGFGITKESSARDGSSCSGGRGGSQEGFNFMFRGRPTSAGESGPGPPTSAHSRTSASGNNFLSPFSIPSTSTGTTTFSFTLSSTTNTTTTSSNSASQYGGSTSQPQFPPFYPISGVSNQQRPRVPAPGLSHPPLQPSQVSMPMFMNQHGPNTHSQQGSGSHSLGLQTPNQERMPSPGLHNQRRNQFPPFMGDSGISSSHTRDQNQFSLSDQPRHHLGSHDKGHSQDNQPMHSSGNQAGQRSQLPRSSSVGRSPHMAPEVSFYTAPNFQSPPPINQQSNNPTLPTPPLHHPARSSEQPSSTQRSNFDQSLPPPPPPSNQQFTTIHHPDFSSPNFEPQPLQFSRSANTNTSQSQPSSFSSSETVRLQKTSNQNRPVEPPPPQQQPPPPQQQPPPPQPQQPQQQRSKNIGGGSSSKSHLQKSNRSKQKKSAAANRCEVDTNLSNSIFESGRSMTPLFPMAGLSPPPSRQLQSDGPTYLPANLFSNAARPLSTSNPLQHKNAEINGPFNPLFQPSRPQNGLGLNFQPGFGMNAVHSNHVTSSQMITPHSNAVSVTHMPNFNLSNIFPDVNGPGGQPDSLNMSPIKFAHGNAILQSQAGLDHNGLQHHPHGPGAPQLYHHNRSHPPPPQVIHNAMSINSILSHNHHGFDPRQMAPGINSTMTTPFGSHGHPAAFGMAPLNFPMHDH